MMSSDGVTVGSHTVTHPILTRMPEEEVTRELFQSRQRLEEELGVPIRHFCYPNGRPQDFTPAIQRLVKAAGFQSACSTIGGINQPSEDRFALKRLDGAQVSLREFVRVLTGEST